MHQAICILFNHREGALRSEIDDAASNIVDTFYEVHSKSDDGVGVDADGGYIITGLDDVFIKGRLAEDQKLSPAMPKSFQDALDFATQIVAIDLGLFNASPYFFGGTKNEGNDRISKMNRGDLLTHIFQDIPESLADEYGRIAGTTPMVSGEVRIQDYRRYKRVQSFEYLRLAEFPPFADGIGTACEHRAFDLREDPYSRIECNNTAILIADCYT